MGEKTEGCWLFLPILNSIVPKQNINSSISAIQLADGSITSDPLTINHVFASYYGRLYDDPMTPLETTFTGFFSSLDFPTLSDSHKNLLDQDITIEEVETAIHFLPYSKTPGLNGLLSEWHQAYTQIIAPKLLATFHELLDQGILPDSMNEALIVVLPKPVKDKLLCGSYRPISLSFK